MEGASRRDWRRASSRESRVRAAASRWAADHQLHGTVASQVASPPPSQVFSSASEPAAAAAASASPRQPRGSPPARSRLRLGSSWAALVLLLLVCSTSPLALAADGSSPRRALLQQLPPQSEIILAAVLGSLLVVVFVVAIVLVCCCFSFAKATPGKEGQGKSTQKIVSAPDEVAVPTLCFNDVQVATDGFSDDAIIGGAGHTTVYRGEGPDGEPWAVKRAKRVTVSGSHLFRNEVDFLSQIKHPNIVPLLYSCDDNSEQILVFEYLANGPLSTWLRPPPGDERAALTFEQRVEAALSVGEAVQYLHSFSRPTIIHRDVKSDTILLDHQLKVKLGGLGLLKHLPGEGMRLRVARKKGYLDPEYFQTFKVTPRCDVYSFGVVMLEMLTALPPIVQGLPRSSPTAADATCAGDAPSPSPPMSLPQWALPLIQEDRVEELVDPRMPPGYPRDSLVAFARIAAECVAPLRKDRPDMPRVTFLLAELKRPAALRSVAFARFYTGDHKAVPILHAS
ncbi:hypothetical protein CLOM_g18018 [Closterium sp. NIES-68]|nr:hypothetical protein CLOM_g18018 [Closterium sp. NIES-68]GJP75392.1 hypothetical protein CLOP_g5845 [Closterium sp. NIES-67]